MAKVQIDPALTGRARFAAACRVNASQVAAPAPIDTAEKKELTGRARFNASIAKDFATIKK